jgi:hypothetical protein
MINNKIIMKKIKIIILIQIHQLIKIKYRIIKSGIHLLEEKRQINKEKEK